MCNRKLIMEGGVMAYGHFISFLWSLPTFLVIENSTFEFELYIYIYLSF